MNPKFKWVQAEENLEDQNEKVESHTVDREKAKDDDKREEEVRHSYLNLRWIVVVQKILIFRVWPKILRVQNFVHATELLYLPIQVEMLNYPRGIPYGLRDKYQPDAQAMFTCLHSKVNDAFDILKKEEIEINKNKSVH